MAPRKRVRSAPAGSGEGEVIAAMLPCSCGNEAVVEKRGRTVCRTCANAIDGREYPLRGGRERCSFGSAVEARQLDMQRLHGPMRYQGRFIG